MEGLRQKVLDAIQSGFPLEEDPYGVLAAGLGAPRGDVLAAVGALRADGTIRRLGASFSSAKLGYTSTLCALAVPGGQDALDAAAAVVDAFPNVTHDYARDDARYNLWFTLITRDADEKARILGEVRTRTRCDDLLDLPATALYKIRVDFGAMEGRLAKAAPQDPVSPPACAPFDPESPFDVALVRWAQGDIAGAGARVDAEPFDTAAAAIAAQVGDPCVDAQRVLARLRDLKATGAIRRFGAMVAHRKAGFAFNGMTVWDVPDGEADKVGSLFASFPFVSHCYARPRAKTWPHNLYAMVHAKTREELDGRVAQLEAAAGIPARVLVSTREYKKTSMRYFAEDAASGLRDDSPPEEKI